MTKTVKCPKCGKLFESTPLWVYKDEKGIYCTWTCYNHRNDRKKDHPNNSAAKIHTKRVEQYTLDGQLIAVFDSAQSAAEAVGCSKTDQIRNVCRGRAETCRGFVWKYADECKK